MVRRSARNNGSCWRRNAAPHDCEPEVLGVYPEQTTTKSNFQARSTTSQCAREGPRQFTSTGTNAHAQSVQPKKYPEDRRRRSGWCDIAAFHGHSRTRGLCGRTHGAAQRLHDGGERSDPGRLSQGNHGDEGAAGQRPLQLDLSGGHPWHDADARSNRLEHLPHRFTLLLVVAPDVPLLVRAHRQKILGHV